MSVVLIMTASVGAAIALMPNEVEIAVLPKLRVLEVIEKAGLMSVTIEPHDNDTYIKSGCP